MHGIALKIVKGGILLLLLPQLALAAGEVPYGFVLDGVLYDSPGGTTTLLDTGTIRVQILNPAKTCVLYDEQQNFNTTSSNGAFSLSIGTAVGSGRRVAGSDAGNSMTTVFQNRTASITGAGACTYNPTAGDGRYVRVFVTPTSTGVTDQLSPEMLVGSVPTSLVAESLQGIDKTGFLQLGAQDLTQANVETVFTTANYATLTSLLSGGGSTGGSNTGAYTINSGTGGSGGINFNTNGTTRASIAYNGDFTVGSNALFVNGTTGKVGLGTNSTTYDFSLGGAISRAIGMERNSTANTAGNSLTVSSGGATSGATDKAGGDLYLASGAATGTGSSNIYLQTATAGGAGTTDRSPTTKMTILGSGNVGIGTASPGDALTVTRSGSTFVSANSSTGSAGFAANTTSGTRAYNYFYQGGAGVDQKFKYIMAEGGNFIFGKANDTWSTETNQMTISNAGNVGIGISPSYPLDVRSTNVTASTEVVVGAFMGPGSKGVVNTYVTDGTSAITQGRIRSSGSIPLALGTTNSVNAVTILDNGSVGIGTTGPNTKLHVSGSGDVVSTVQTSSGTGSSAALRLIGGATNADWHIVTNRGDLNGSADSLGFYKTSGTSGTKMVIQDNGYVGIGKTNPDRPVDIALDAPGLDLLRIQNKSASGYSTIDFLDSDGNDQAAFGFANGSAASSAGRSLFWIGGSDFNIINNSAPLMTILNGGNVGIGIDNPTYQLQLSTDSAAKPGTGTWDIASDERLKDIRAPYTRGLDAITQLNTIYFNYKQDNPLGLPSEKEYVGIRAQDAQKAVPEAVSIDKQGYLHLTNDSIIWAAVNAIKELYAKFLGQDRQIASVQEKVSRLEAENAQLKATDQARDQKLNELEQRLERLEKSLASK